MGMVVDLEKKTGLTAYIDSFKLGSLLDRVRVVKGVLEVENSEDCVSGMVVEDYWGTGKMLVFHSPESDVFLSAGDQFISFDWTEL